MCGDSSVGVREVAASVLVTAVRSERGMSASGTVATVSPSARLPSAATINTLAAQVGGRVDRIAVATFSLLASCAAVTMATVVQAQTCSSASAPIRNSDR